MVVEWQLHLVVVILVGAAGMELVLLVVVAVQQVGRQAQAVDAVLLRLMLAGTGHNLAEPAGDKHATHPNVIVFIALNTLLKQQPQQELHNQASVTVKGNLCFSTSYAIILQLCVYVLFTF